MSKKYFAATPSQMMMEYLYLYEMKADVERRYAFYRSQKEFWTERADHYLLTQATNFDTAYKLADDDLLKQFGASFSSQNNNVLRPRSVSICKHGDDIAINRITLELVHVSEFQNNVYLVCVTLDANARPVQFDVRVYKEIAVLNTEVVKFAGTFAAFADARKVLPASVSVDCASFESGAFALHEMFGKTIAKVDFMSEDVRTNIAFAAKNALHHV